MLPRKSSLSVFGALLSSTDVTFKLCVSCADGRAFFSSADVERERDFSITCVFIFFSSILSSFFFVESACSPLGLKRADTLSFRILKGGYGHPVTRVARGFKGASIIGKTRK